MEVSGQNDEYDSFNVAMTRGDLLRQLRKMAMEDEAAREAEYGSRDAGDTSISSDTLVYQSYLNDQSYFDDYKHVNYRFIDYGEFGPSNHPLIVEQERALGKGGFCWDASFILGQHFLRMQPLPIDVHSILELGSGPGVTGLMAARALPQVRVDLTDLPSVLPLLQRNVKDTPNASAFALEWGSKTVTDKYDVILGADVVASIYSSSALVETLHNQSHENTWVFISVRDRLASTIEPFEMEMRKLFRHVERRVPMTDLKTPNVSIFIATGKVSMQ